MDTSQPDMDSYEYDSSEDLFLKRKCAKSPSLSTINESSCGLSSGASESERSVTLSRGSGFTDLKKRAGKMTPKRNRKLFHMKDDDMDLDLPFRDDTKPPPKGQTLHHEAPCKQENNERNMEQEIGLKGNRSISSQEDSPRTPLGDRNQPDVPINLTPKTESRKGNYPKPAITWENTNDMFDSLFVSGIFNSVKPTPPTNKELQTMYVNDSSDDDYQAAPKKRQKLSPPAKKKVQSKLTFKKVKKARKLILDSDSDSEY